MKLPTEWKIMACVVGQEGSDVPLAINLVPLHPTPHQTSMCEDTCPGFLSTPKVKHGMEDKETG